MPRYLSRQPCVAPGHPLEVRAPGLPLIVQPTVNSRRLNTQDLSGFCKAYRVHEFVERVQQFAQVRHAWSPKPTMIAGFYLLPRGDWQTAGKIRSERMGRGLAC